jgi:hypothetical protein
MASTESSCEPAHKLYQDALEANLYEKEFQKPVARTDRGVAVYAAIYRHKEEYAKESKESDTAKSGDRSSAASSQGSAVSPLKQIVRFCEARLSLDTIKDYINDEAFLSDAQSSSYRFNFSTDPLLLAHACGENALPIQRAIRARLAEPKTTATLSDNAFPWPPPMATTREVLPDHLYRQLPQTHSLEDIDRLLLSALETRGYTERSHYFVPHGFALVTRLEQIAEDGTPLQPPDRWSMGKVPLRSISISDWARALFNARPGFYRVIVFIVTDVPFSESSEKVPSKVAGQWLKEGTNVLPAETAQAPLTPKTVCTALIYEFKREMDHDPSFVDGSVSDARTQLKNAGIWSALKLP